MHDCQHIGCDTACAFVHSATSTVLLLQVADGRAIHRIFGNPARAAAALLRCLTFRVSSTKLFCSHTATLHALRVATLSIIYINHALPSQVLLWVCDSALPNPNHQRISTT